MKGIAKTVIYRSKDFDNVPLPLSCELCDLYYKCNFDHPMHFISFDCRAFVCNKHGIRYQFMFNF